VRGRDKFVVLTAIADALKARTYPPMDERLKSIVASQVGTLLKGGYPLDLVRRIAVELALSWDTVRGHNRLTHLQQRVRAIDAGDATAEHAARKRDAAGPLDPRVAAILRGRADAPPERPRPDSHPFRPSSRPDTCADCDGPVGVHVRLVPLDDDGHAAVVPTGIARLPF
jgi:hypothetical protein